MSDRLARAAALIALLALAALGGCGEEPTRQEKKDELNRQFDETGVVQLCARKSPDFVYRMALWTSLPQSNFKDDTEVIRSFMAIVEDSCPEYSQEFAEWTDALKRLPRR